MYVMELFDLVLVLIVLPQDLSFKTIGFPRYIQSVPNSKGVLTMVCGILVLAFQALTSLMMSTGCLLFVVCPSIQKHSVMDSSIPNTLLCSRHVCRLCLEQLLIVELGLNVHDPVSHLDEQGSLQWLGEVVAGHLFCWAALHGQLVLFDPISDKEVSYINVSQSLSS